ncbi:MAG: hypothetical protein GYA85_11900 [Propionibacterium sp.]|nr:hypothetical protein [Propionibacterium sp.]
MQESYVAVAGEWSENDVAVHPPGSLVLSEAGHEHRITTGCQVHGGITWSTVAKAGKASP